MLKHKQHFILPLCLLLAGCTELLLAAPVLPWTTLQAREEPPASADVRPSFGERPIYYKRFVRRRPSPHVNDLDVFEVRTVYYLKRTTPKPPVVQHKLNDAEIQKKIRCDFEPTLSECQAGLIDPPETQWTTRPTSILRPWVPAYPSSTSTSTTTTTTTTTTTSTTTEPPTTTTTEPPETTYESDNDEEDTEDVFESSAKADDEEEEKEEEEPDEPNEIDAEPPVEEEDEEDKDNEDYYQQVDEGHMGALEQ